MRSLKYFLLTMFLVLALVACGGNTANNTTNTADDTVDNTANNTTDNTTENTTGEETTDDTAMNQVEVFSWWTGGGEAAGLEAMIEVFKAENP